MSLSMKIVILTIKSVLWVLRERGRSFGVSLSLSLSLSKFGVFRCRLCGYGRKSENEWQSLYWLCCVKGFRPALCVGRTGTMAGLLFLSFSPFLQRFSSGFVRGPDGDLGGYTFLV